MVRRVIALAAALLVLPACGDYSQLAYRNDHRLTFLAPQSRQLTTLPVSLQWSIEDFRVAEPGSAPPSPGAGYFAVFVDRAPIKPRHTLRDVAGRDSTCKRDPGCPSAEYLAARGVYTTSDAQLTLETVAPLNVHDKEQLHDVTVVLLDTGGRRIGESAWHIEFKLRKRTFR